jgi:hypothetical protein
MRGQLFPHLELAGVVGTLKGDGTERLRDTEQRANVEAERGASRNWGPGHYVLKDALIPRKQSIADTAGIGVDPSVTTVFEPLGAKLYDLTTRSLALGYASGSVSAASKRAQGGSRYEGELAGYRNKQL